MKLNLAASTGLTRGVAHYALRRTLPIHSFEKNLAELLSYCKSARVEEVIVKVDPEDFSHGIPTVEWVKSYQEYLFRAKEALEKRGIIYSLNPWVTLGHCDRERHCDRIYPEIDWMVGHDGTVCNSQACPLSEGWKNLTRQLWTLYSQTNPHVIWIEDDIRLFNHMPVQYACFCQLHLSEFARRYETKQIDREILLQALLAPDKPHPLRAKWLDFQSKVMVETAAFFEKTVHDVSPQTYLGLMSSGPGNHVIEARNWNAFGEALKGNKEILYSRPPLWTYQETGLKDLYLASDTILHTRAVLRDIKMVELTEIDNAPMTRYSKSNAFTFLQMVVSIAFGANGMTLNLYDHLGSPMSIEPTIETLLRESKNYLNGLARLCTDKHSYRGIQLLTSQEGAKFTHLQPGSQYHDLKPGGYGWQRPLNAFGVPTTYEDSPIVAVTGQLLRQYSDDCIYELLSKNLLLDGKAAKVLQQRGFGNHLGCTIKHLCYSSSKVMNAEEFFNEDFGGSPGKFLTTNLKHSPIIEAPMIIETSVTGEKTISRLADADTQPCYSFMVAYENSLGGRIAVLPYDLDRMMGTAFYHPYRKEQIINVLHWLNGGKLDFQVEAECYILPIWMEMKKNTVVGALNLSLDDWPRVKFHLRLNGRKPGSVEWLNQQGRKTELNEQNITIEADFMTITFEGPISFRQPVFINITCG